MPVPALSLVGFLDAPRAISHLATECISSSGDPSQLEVEWETARKALGEATPNAGHPQVLALPDGAGSHIKAALALPWAIGLSNDVSLSQPEFRLVEIDPLIAFQLTVDMARSDDHCKPLSNPPTLEEMLSVCLPLEAPQEKITIQRQANSVLVQARSLNLRLLDAGAFENRFAGITFGAGLAFVQVVRHNENYYLWNGFHRCVGLRLAGATHVPCIVRDLIDVSLLSILENSFKLALLESSNPPTLAHFTSGRAHSVQLKVVTRMLHVSWTEWAVSSE